MCTADGPPRQVSLPAEAQDGVFLGCATQSRAAQGTPEIGEGDTSDVVLIRMFNDRQVFIRVYVEFVIFTKSDRIRLYLGVFPVPGKPLHIGAVFESGRNSGPSRGIPGALPALKR